MLIVVGEDELSDVQDIFILKKSLNENPVMFVH